MTWEGVPWMVNEAEHSAEVGRLLARLAMGKNEGVIEPTDCKVTASAIPDGNVHIAPGGVGVQNRGEGAGSQGYVLRNVGDEVAATTPQGSSGVRYDLVCVVVEDPQYAGQPDPASVEDGPYLRTKIYTNVSATATSLAEVDADQTGLALARVKFDASDGTVSGADITDLRHVLKPEVRTDKHILNGVATSNLVSGGSGSVSPPGASFPVTVPEWATHVQLEAIWSGVQFVDGGAGTGLSQGGARVELGAMVSDYTVWQADATGPSKPITQTIMAAEEVDCSAYVGQTLNLRGTIVVTAQSGMTGRTTPYTTLVVSATFIQRAI